MDLRVMRGLLVALRLNVENVLAMVDAELEAAAAPRPGCPYCGEQERIEDTSTARAPRQTCLACGRSWGTLYHTPNEVTTNG